MIEMHSEAELSEDRLYRYRLARFWAAGPRVTFVMLNPSIADETVHDPTLRRCLGFAKEWGFNGVNVVNLYALRATDPMQLWSVDDPVGPENDRYLREAAAGGAPIVAAWGAHAKRARVQEVLSIPGFDRLRCLRVTKNGYPSHPLYLPKTLKPVPWSPELYGHAS